jgi:high-affinity Fe2+/Pb2+ permease
MASDDFRYWLNDCRDGPGLFRAFACEMLSLLVRVILVGAGVAVITYIGIYLLFDYKWWEIPVQEIFWALWAPLTVFAVGKAEDFTRPPKT